MLPSVLTCIIPSVCIYVEKIKNDAHRLTEAYDDSAEQRKIIVADSGDTEHSGCHPQQRDDVHFSSAVTVSQTGGQCSSQRLSSEDEGLTELCQSRLVTHQ